MTVTAILCSIHRSLVSDKERTGYVVGLLKASQRRLHRSSHGLDGCALSET